MKGIGVARNPLIKRKLTPKRRVGNLIKLHKACAQPGETINPYGRLGKIKGRQVLGWRDSDRDYTVAKKRERLEDTAAHALEAAELQRLARENATAAMTRLIRIVKNPKSPDTTAILAGNVILDRGYGKASQTNINANLNGDGKANEIDGVELDKRIAGAIDRIERVTSRAAKATPGQKRPPDLRERNRNTRVTH